MIPVIRKGSSLYPQVFLQSFSQESSEYSFWHPSKWLIYGFCLRYLCSKVQRFLQESLLRFLNSARHQGEDLLRNSFRYSSKYCFRDFTKNPHIDTTLILLQPHLHPKKSIIEWLELLDEFLENHWTRSWRNIWSYYWRKKIWRKLLE